MRVLVRTSVRVCVCGLQTLSNIPLSNNVFQLTPDQVNRVELWMVRWQSEDLVPVLAN